VAKARLPCRRMPKEHCRQVHGTGRCLLVHQPHVDRHPGMMLLLPMDPWATVLVTLRRRYAPLMRPINLRIPYRPYRGNVVFTTLPGPNQRPGRACCHMSDALQMHCPRSSPPRAPPTCEAEGVCVHRPRRTGTAMTRKGDDDQRSSFDQRQSEYKSASSMNLL
jgi:hypothetical protein